MRCNICKLQILNCICNKKYKRSKSPENAELYEVSSTVKDIVSRYRTNGVSNNNNTSDVMKKKNGQTIEYNFGNRRYRYLPASLNIKQDDIR